MALQKNTRLRQCFASAIPAADLYQATIVDVTRQMMHLFSIVFEIPLLRSLPQ